MGSTNVNVLTGDFTLKSMPPCDLSSCTKGQIRRYFENSYDLYESLFTSLKDQKAFYKCPDRLRLPLIFYYGHTAAVYINKLVLAELIQPSERVNLHFETLFETGVNEMSWDDMGNYRLGGELMWPALGDVAKYREHVKKLILRVIDKTPLQLPVTFDSTWWPVFIGIEHERLHLETSSVLIQQLPVHMVEQPPGWIYGPLSAGEPVLENRMIRVKAMTVTLGKPSNFPTYGWDNEYGKLDCRVPEFEASEHLITNREFLAFIKDGGYTNRDVWTVDGWGWLEYRQVRHPAFWTCGGDCKAACGADLASYSHCKAAGDWMKGTHGETSGVEDEYRDYNTSIDGTYRLRVMFDVIAMPWDWPVVINYHEAKAFCAWKGPDYRLPCEAEHRIIRGTKIKSGDLSSQSEMQSNINLRYGSCTPVNLHPVNDYGFYNAEGNVWEWMEDDFNGLPGATTSAFYDDFSSPYYDGLHTTILGGSWVTTGDATSGFARGWFRRHFLQHAGFRVVRSVTSDHPVNVKLPVCRIHRAIDSHGLDKKHHRLPESVQCEAMPSSSRQLQQDTAQILEMQLYQDWVLELPPGLSAVNMTETASNKYLTGPGGRCLYLGCGTGRGVATLGTQFEEVLAVDFNGHFIDTCLKLQKGLVVSLPHGIAISVPTDGLTNVTFKQLNWLPNEVGCFDLVLCTLLDRVNNYKGWLVRMKEIVKSRGILIVTSQLYGADTVQAELKSYFELLETKDLHVSPDAGDMKTMVWRHN